MKNILLPTDFSKNSINAINYAVELYKDVACNFYVLNVQKASSFISDDMMSISPSATIYNTIIDAAKKSITNIITQIETSYKNKNHTLYSIVDYDNFVDSINQASEKYDIDLIIMGTRGASGLEKVIFGTNTVHVMQRCKVPVLAIPDGCTFTGLNNIAFTSSNLLASNIKTLEPLKDLTSMFEFNLSVLHIPNEKHIEQNQNSIFDFFKIYFKKVKHELLEVKKGNTYDIVHKYIEENDINILSFMDEKHSFFERFFTKHPVETFAFKIDIPFLVMKKTD
ncbi:universal stress protein [Thalassobellus citreus]|uniref:universal stress protein n=1 Tax=Thalassobellus citreus TaxID=3367752 RepID=UPI0037BDE107